jgi:hypothetical protein
MHFCMELPIHTSKIHIDRHFLYSKKRMPGLNPPPPETMLCTLVIMMKKMDVPLVGTVRLTDSLCLEVGCDSLKID